MNRIDNDSSFRSLLKKYTFWYAVCAILCLFPVFILSHKSFITSDDGLHQQYVYYIYVGKWIRELLGNIFVRHIFEIPMWDMSIGMGSDSLIVLSGVTSVLADPFFWTSALVDQRYSEYVFNAIVIIKLYITGIAFLFFCFEKGKRSYDAVTGAVLYVFSASILVGLRQMFFMNTFICFPLLMAGADRLWIKRGKTLYIAVLAYMTLYSPYFTYISGMILIVYCVVRFLVERKNIRELGKLMSRFIVCTCIGIMIGIGPEIPSICNLLGLNRLQLDRTYPIVDLSILKEQVTYAFSYRNLWHESIWGFSSIAFIALILLFKERKGDLLLKILFIISFTSFSIPLIGSMMNGFDYSANRYVFGYAFLLSYIVVVKIPDFKAFRGKLFAFSLMVSLVYLVFVAFGSTSAKISGISLVVIILSVGLSNHLLRSEKAGYYSLMITAVLSCLFIGIASNNESSYEYIDRGSANETLFTIPDISDGYVIDRTRFDVLPYTYTDVSINSSMITDDNGYDFYHSSYNNYVDRYYDDMSILGSAIGYQRSGLRSRGFLELLNGTEYIFRQNDEPRVIRAPYSYEKVDVEGTYDVYRSSRGSSPIFFYDEAVSYDEYDIHDLYEREEIMMRYCVIEEVTSAPGISSDDHTKIGYGFGETVGLDIGDGIVTVNGDSGYIMLDVDPISERDIGILITDLNHEGGYYFQFAVVLMNGDKTVAADFFAGIDTGYDYYYGKDTLLFDFGYIDEEVDTIRLYFNTPGEFSLGDVAIFTRDTEQLISVTDDFYEHSKMEDITYDISGNHISITALADKDKYLYIAVPYSEGWSATVDGEDVEILRANEAFMAIRLSEGEHVIKLSYCTPYLGAGLAVSLICIAGFCIFEVFNNRREGKWKKV